MRKSRKLFAGILLFILLDLSILLINYWIAYQVSNDAVAINLAGRQRMLSQRITKSLLSIQAADNAESRKASVDEFIYATRLFDETLTAFDAGGKATGGDGKSVLLQQVRRADAIKLVDEAQAIWKNIHAPLTPYLGGDTEIPDTVITQAKKQMLAHNLDLLNLMNRLTSSLEHDSLTGATNLRLIQTAVFFLALLNFVFIVRKFHLNNEEAHRAKAHYTELAIRDPLTGLYKRREFENNLKREMSAVNRRMDDKFAIVMVDLDGFKPINDQHGHAAGDVVLKTIADRLGRLARTTDTVARIGGDEFVLICTTLRTPENATTFCERLLSSINDPIILDSAQVQVGASIGVAFYPNASGQDDNLIHLADEAMYAAKKAGRNRYILVEH